MVEDVFGILGTTLAGAFHVEEVIAEGGFGVVYRAEHVAFRAPVALKCLKIPGTISPGQSEVFVENFREEAEILFHLSAQIPEVVRPLHADAITLDDGTFVPYLAMEWIDGKPLDSIIILRQDDGLPPLDIRAVLKMLSPIAHALSKAHRFQVPGGAIVSVTHCDLKPENIVVTERETPVRAKILDFGIARARDMMRQNVGRITDSEASRPFTPSYGAPEQWVPKRYGQSGPWTDVWGLALTCVECLTGDPPIDGDMHAMMGTCLDRGRRPTPRTEGAEVSDEVEEVFLKALAVDPRDRYNDIESFWSALEDAVGVPSSFERARRRRARPTYDYDRSSELPPLPEEFDGLEIEESAEQEPSTSDFPSIPPPPPRISPQSRSSLEAVIDDPYEEDEGPFSARELNLAEEPFEGPFSEQPSVRDAPVVTPSIDLDLGGGLDVPSPKPSRPRPAVTSGTWAAGELTRSGSHPVATLGRSGAHRPPVIPEPEPEQTFLQQLRVPLQVFAVGVVVIILDVILLKVMGEPFSIGPVRLRYIAAGITVIALVLAFLSLSGEKE